MPRITLSSVEHEDLKIRSEETFDTSVEEYERARLERIDRVPDGDTEGLRKVLADYPPASEIAARQKAEDDHTRKLEAIQRRRPQTPAEQAKFNAAMDAVPDGDKDGVRKVLAEFGLLAVDEDDDALLAYETTHPALEDDEDN